MRRTTRCSDHLGALCGAVLLVCLALAGCEIAKPELPTFTTRVAVPLGVERVDVADLVDDEDYLVELADGALGFHVAGDPQTVSLDLDLAADIAAVAVSGELGPFAIDVAAPANFDFALEDLYPEAGALHGMTVPISGFGFASASEATDLADLASASLVAGTLTVTVSNGLPVPVSATGGPDRLHLELIDPVTELALVTVEFDPIAAGAEASEVADLAGVTLPGAVAVRLVGGSPGSDGTPVTVDAAAVIGVEAVFDDLEVSAAETIVGPQTFTSEFVTDLPDDYAVTRAVIQSGTVPLALDNDMAIPCQLTVSWPDIVDLDEAPLTVVVDLAGGASTTSVVNFAGRVIRAPNETPLVALTATVSVTSPGSDGQPVFLEADQGVRAELQGGRLVFASVTGVVPVFAHEFEPVAESIELPDELDGLILTQARMVLEIANSVGLAAATDFDLIGVNADGESRNLAIAEPIAAGGDDRATVTEIVLDETNSAIVDFLNHLPVEIALTGTVQVGGDGASGTIRPDDEVVLSWQIDSPMEVIVESSQVVTDPSALDLDDDTRERIGDHAGAASIQFEVLNHLPLGVAVQILFGTDPDEIGDTPLLTIGPVTVAAADVDPVTHEVAAPVVSYPTVTLSAAQMQVLATENLHQSFAIELPSTDGQLVRILTSDYLTVGGMVAMDVVVNEADND